MEKVAVDERGMLRHVDEAKRLQALSLVREGRLRPRPSDRTRRAGSRSTSSGAAARRTSRRSRPRFAHRNPQGRARRSERVRGAHRRLPRRIAPRASAVRVQGRALGDSPKRPGSASPYRRAHEDPTPEAHDVSQPSHPHRHSRCRSLRARDCRHRRGVLAIRGDHARHGADQRRQELPIHDRPHLPGERRGDRLQGILSIWTANAIKPYRTIAKKKWVVGRSPTRRRPARRDGPTARVLGGGAAQLALTGTVKIEADIVNGGAKVGSQV